MRIAVLDDYQGVASRCADWRRLPAAAEVEFFSDHLTDREALAQRLADFEAVVAMRERTPFPAALLARLPKLRLIVTAGMSNAAIDVAAARERHITVCGTTGGASSATAELAWGLVIALARHIPVEDRAVRNGQWQTTVGRSLHGATLGVLGLGHLGSRVARYGQAFGMQVLAWSHNLTAERAREHGAELVPLDELLGRSDFISIHLKLSARTRGLIDARALGLMKPQACVVNTSRGPIVDEAALVTALRAGRIGGAGLDTFDVEPLPAGHPLGGLPNVVLTPHIGYVVEATYQAWYGGALEDIEAFMAGKPIRVIDKPADYDSGIS